MGCQEAAVPVRRTLSFSLGRFVVAALLATRLTSAQASVAPVPLKFEVASVKVATSGRNGVSGGCRGIDSVYSAEEQKRGGIPSLGRCVITDARLSHLIGIAYGVSMQVLDTSPDWIQRGDLRFDVQAKAEHPATATRQQLLTMLQNLLVERFQIKSTTSLSKNRVLHWWWQRTVRSCTRPRARTRS